MCAGLRGQPTATASADSRTVRSAIDQHWARCNTYVRLTLAAHVPQPTGSLTHGRQRLVARGAREPRISTKGGRARAADHGPQALRFPGRAPRDGVRAARPHATTAGAGADLAQGRAATGAAATGAAGAAATGAAGARRAAERDGPDRAAGPPGCQPGQIISAQHNGQTIQVACPPGCPPGATFQVQVPAAQPVPASGGDDACGGPRSSGGRKRTLCVGSVLLLWLDLGHDDRVGRRRRRRCSRGHVPLEHAPIKAPADATVDA